MKFFIGIVTVFGYVIFGYLLGDGHLRVLWQPSEFMIIIGSALGAYIIANSSKILAETPKALMEEEMEVLKHESEGVCRALPNIADSTPALGIVAAVLGVIHTTMGSINQPPEILGRLIGGALVGTFVGVLLSYGFIGPMAQSVGSIYESDLHYIRCVRACLLAFLNGSPPLIPVECGRKSLKEKNRPTFAELEDASKLVKNEDLASQKTIYDFDKKLSIKKIQGIIENQLPKWLQNQVAIDFHSNGMRITLFDRYQKPMFSLGSSVPYQYTRDVLKILAQTFKDLPYRIKIFGHTDATPYSSESQYTNWELSSDRANACRRALEAGGIPLEKFDSVTGKGASELFNKKDPFAPENRRLSIFLGMDK